jgi:hypothetical protein
VIDTDLAALEARCWHSGLPLYVRGILNLLFDCQIERMTSVALAEWLDRLQKAYDLPALDAVDVHTLTGGIMSRRAYAEVTPDARRFAKQINFAMLYGAAHPHLAPGEAT